MKLLRYFGLSLVILVLVFVIGLLFLAFGFYDRVIRPTPLPTHSGQLNVLILGKGDKTHTSPDLTDTIILLHLDLKKNKLSFLSFPRDIWDEKLKIKINAAYYWGKQKNQPFRLPKEVIYRLSGIWPDRVIILDFSTFKKIINDLGGVFVNVPDSFDDYRYPIPGREKAYPISSRYEHVHFDAGWQWMDGQRALVFVRSRHAQGKEGSDFARGKRQELVIRAILSRLLAEKNYYLLHPQQTYQMIRSWWEEIETDISFNQLAKIAYLMARNQLFYHQPIKVRNFSFSSDFKLLRPEKKDVFGEKVWLLIPLQPRFKDYLNHLITS